MNALPVETSVDLDEKDVERFRRLHTSCARYVQKEDRHGRYLSHIQSRLRDGALAQETRNFYVLEVDRVQNELDVARKNYRHWDTTRRNFDYDLTNRRGENYARAAWYAGLALVPDLDNE